MYIIILILMQNIEKNDFFTHHLQSTHINVYKVEIKFNPGSTVWELIYNNAIFNKLDQTLTVCERMHNSFIINSCRGSYNIIWHAMKRYN